VNSVSCSKAAAIAPHLATDNQTFAITPHTSKKYFNIFPSLNTSLWSDRFHSGFPTRNYLCVPFDLCILHSSLTSQFLFDLSNTIWCV